MVSLTWTLKEHALIMKASKDPIFFAENPFFLGLTLYPMQKEILKAFYDGNYRELILLIGRRGSKSFLASIFALFETFKLLILDEPAEYYSLAPGTKIFIMARAVSEDQARDTIFSQIKTKLQRSPFFTRSAPKIYSLEIQFPKKSIIIYCGTSSSASMVGRDVKCLIIDEIAKFDDSKTSKRGAWNVYNSLSRNTALFGNEGKKIILSSPTHVDDIIMGLYTRSQQFDNMLGIRCPTWEANPHISFDSPDMQMELAKDPISFWTDFGCRPSSLTEFYFGNREILRVTEQQNILELFANKIPFTVTPRTYVLAGDPALKHDAFGIGLGHLELNEYHIDGLWRLKPEGQNELDPFKVCDFILSIIDKFHPIYTVFDSWFFLEMQERIKRKGVPVLTHMVKKEDYDRVKELLYTEKLVICDYPFVLEELKNLKLYRGKKVDHPPGGSKDVADVLANVVWALDNTSLQRPSTPLVIGQVV